jgi:hypothetical protein
MCDHLPKSEFVRANLRVGGGTDYVGGENVGLASVRTQGKSFDSIGSHAQVSRWIVEPACLHVLVCDEGRIVPLGVLSGGGSAKRLATL